MIHTATGSFGSGFGWNYKSLAVDGIAAFGGVQRQPFAEEHQVVSDNLLYGRRYYRMCCPVFVWSLLGVFRLAAYSLIPSASLGTSSS